MNPRALLRAFEEIAAREKAIESAPTAERRRTLRQAHKAIDELSICARVLSDPRAPRTDVQAALDVVERTVGAIWKNKAGVRHAAAMELIAAIERGATPDKPDGCALQWYADRWPDFARRVARERFAEVVESWRESRRGGCGSAGWKPVCDLLAIVVGGRWTTSKAIKDWERWRKRWAR